MLLRLRLILLSFGGGVLLLLLLCLGSQNLSQRHSLRFAGYKSIPLPSGVLVGLSLVIGVISGGSTAALLVPDQQRD